MKTRQGFVSNSSSCSFTITNKSNEIKTLLDFVEENPQLVQEFCEQYYWYTITQSELLASAQDENIVFQPNSSKLCVFGDEMGTVVGLVFDYILRNGGQSKNFSWEFYKMLR